MIENPSGRCVFAAEQIPHRPGPAPVLGLRAGSDGLSMITQTGLAENRGAYATPLARIFRRSDAAVPGDRLVAGERAVDDGEASVNGQGVGGGVYNVGTFVFDIATLITGNHASTSNDDGFGY